MSQTLHRQPARVIRGKIKTIDRALNELAHERRDLDSELREFENGYSCEDTADDLIVDFPEPEDEPSSTSS